MDNQQIDHLIRKIDDLVSSHGRMSSTFKNLTSNAIGSGGDKGKSADNLRRVAAAITSTEKAVDGLVSSTHDVGSQIFGAMSGDLKSFQSSIKSSIRSVSSFFGMAGTGGILADAFGGLTSLAGSLTEDFNKLSDSGKTFSGGVLDMAQAAFQSGMTITQYTEYMHKNSLIAASMGNQNGGLSMLAKRTREAGIQFGEFGYSMAGLDDLTAQYADRMRATGQLGELQNKNLGERIIGLARDTTALSKAFGVSREELTKQTTDLIKNNPFLVGKNSDGLMTAMSGLIATGPMGTALANIAAMGRDKAYLSDEYKGLTEAGPMGQYIAELSMQTAEIAKADKSKAFEASIIQNNKMYDLAHNPANKSQIDNLEWLAAGGNQKAKELLTYLAGLHEVNVKEALADRDRSDKIDVLTKALNTFGISWANMTSQFNLGIANGLTPFFDKLKGTDAEKALNSLFGEDGPLVHLGERLGKFVASFITEDRINRVSAWIDRLFNEESIAKATKWIDDLFDPAKSGDLIKSMIDNVFGEGTFEPIKKFMSNFDILANAVNTITDNFGLIATSLVGIYLGLKAVTVASSVAGGLGKAGAAMSGLFSKGAGAGAAEAGAAGAAGTAAKVGGGLFGKSLPFAGDLLQGYLAYSESGSITRGLMAGAGSLGGRLVGGAAGTAVLPGAGTVAGSVMGSVAGAKGGTAAYDAAHDWWYGRGGTHPAEKQAPPPQTNVTPAKFSANLLGNLTQSTQDTLAPAMSAMADSLDDTATLTNDRQTDALLQQLEGIKRTIVLQTEVMAGLINDLSGNIKTGNSALETISKKGG